MNQTPRVAVVTVSYDSGEFLERFAASIAASSTEPLALVVVDNGSTDGAPERLRDARPEASVLMLSENKGYGGAVNAACVGLGPEIDWILVANPDVELGRGSVDELLDELDRHDDVAAVGPHIADAAGRTYPSARRFPSFTDGIGHALLVRIWPGNPWSRHYLQTSTAVEPRDVDWLSGACILLRRSAFDEVGGFDERYFMYFEDVDLCFRLGQAGWRRRYRPSSEIMHVGAHSTTTRQAAMVRAHHESAARFVATRYPGPLWAPVRGLVRVGLRVRAALGTRAGRG